MPISTDSALSDALDEDSPTRRESIRFLIDCADPGIEDRLFPARAAAAPGDTADLRALPLLAGALHDRNWRVRCNAAQAIRLLGREVDFRAEHVALVAESLFACRADRHAELARNAAWALADLGQAELTGDDECPPLPSTWAGN